MSREKKFILEFIELYRGFPQIWKVKSVDYKDRTLRKYAFGELLKKLKEVEPDATVDSVRKKINCLRTAYRRELKKQKASERSGADAADIYDPTLFYFSEMSFIRNQETPETELLAESEQMSGAKSKQSEVMSNDILKLACDHLKNKQNDDEATTISKTWAIQFRKIPENQKLFAKKAIDDILFEASLGTLNRESVEINQPNTIRMSHPNIKSRTRAPNKSINNSSSPYPILNRPQQQRGGNHNSNDGGDMTPNKHENLSKFYADSSQYQ